MTNKLDGDKKQQYVQDYATRTPTKSPQQMILTVLPLSCLIVLENANVIITEHTRVHQREPYKISHLILTTEVAKLLLACCMEAYDTNFDLWASLRRHVLLWKRAKNESNGGNNGNSIMNVGIVIPAVLFYVQNSLFFVALTNLPPPVFQVTYQMKLLWTALFSTVILNRYYTSMQWSLLFCLSVGVAMAASSSSSLQQRTSVDNGSSSDDDTAMKRQKGHGGDTMDGLIVGLLAVMMGSICSALAGVMFEKNIKQRGSSRSDDQQPLNNRCGPPNEFNMVEEGNEEVVIDRHVDEEVEEAAETSDTTTGTSNREHEYLLKPSLWMREIQLALLSIACVVVERCCSAVFQTESKLEDSRKIYTRESNEHFASFFDGFSLWVWLLILLRATNGLLVAIIIKLTDNVVKQMVSGLSAVVGCALSVLFFQSELTPQFIFGSCLVLTSCHCFPNNSNRLAQIFLRETTGTQHSTMLRKWLFTVLSGMLIVVFMAMVVTVKERLVAMGQQTTTTTTTKV